MARFELIKSITDFKDEHKELDIYNNQGVLSLESDNHDQFFELYLSPVGEKALRDILNDRHDSMERHIKDKESK